MEEKCEPANEGAQAGLGFLAADGVHVQAEDHGLALDVFAEISQQCRDPFGVHEGRHMRSLRPPLERVRPRFAPIPGSSQPSA